MIKIGEILLDGCKADILQTLYECGEFCPNFGFVWKDGQIALEVYAEFVPEAIARKLEVKQ